MGSFLWIQWDRLGWPLPDQILPFRGMLQIAQEFGDLIQRPVLPAFSSSIQDIEMVSEDARLLLVSKVLDENEIKHVVRDLTEIFPKKIDLLTLF
ncbi:MAG: protein phosphatase 2C family protein [Chlamydiia bacterium]|nr:protein phosphatase 2C family protein [Chlamydiia bacterium]